MAANEADCPSVDRAPIAPTGRIGRPVFVGGTGRSGTSVTGRILESSSELGLIPIEVRFHVDPGGLSDLIKGRTTVDRFVAKMQQRWYRRLTKAGQARGLHLIIDEDDWLAALETFESTGREDPLRGSRQLMSDLLDPPARAKGASRWVEMTPPNVLEMKALARIYPEAQFVHVYRDGRDVAHSVVSMAWGPNDLSDALVWWEKTFIDALDEMGGIEQAVHVVSMEGLVSRNRDETVRHLFEFIGEPIDASVRDYFDREVSGDRAHIGRWREGLDDKERRSLDDQYDAAIARIRNQFPGIELDLRVD